MRCVLVGNYGNGNFGDECLREYFLQAFPQIEWVVLSARPDARAKELPRLPGGLRSLLTTPWWRTLGAIRRSDAVVFGGGTLFTDTESAYACFLWWLHAAIARAFRCPRIFAFQGVGPFRTAFGERLARSALRGALLVTVRDPASAARVRAWGLNNKCVQTFDPIFALFHEKKKDHRGQDLLIVIPRRNSGEHLRNRVEKVLQEQRISQCHVLLLQPDDTREQEVGRGICQSLPGNHATTCTILEIRTVDALMASLAQAACVVTERFHAALAALAAGVPTEAISQGDGDKLAQLQGARHDSSMAATWLQAIRTGEQVLRASLAQLRSEHHRSDDAESEEGSQGEEE